MSLLNFENNNSVAPRSKKPLKVIFGIGALTGAIALGSTLAASINLNSGASIEFGQGIAQTTACDSNIVLTPYSSFINTQGGGSFKLEVIKVSDVDLAACSGKDFIIKAYGASPTALNFNGNNSSIRVSDNGTTYSIQQYSGIMLEPINDTSFNLIIDSADPTTLSADLVYTITIESKTHEYIGDTGPGGGTIFYFNAAGFDEVGAPCSPNCHYLEFAPTGWNGTQLDPGLKWSYGKTQDMTTTGLSGASGSQIGTGFANTELMASYPLGSEAAFIVQSYGASDESAGEWFIPSSAELDLLLRDANMSLGFVTGANAYWSSTESIASRAMWQYPLSFISGNDAKDLRYYIRPIRAF